MAAVVITTTPDVDTTQRVQLSGSSYTLRIVWSQRGNVFHMHMADTDGNALVNGIRLVTLWPILHRYHYMPAMPPGELWFLDLRNQKAHATLADMGSRFRLYYVTNNDWGP